MKLKCLIGRHDYGEVERIGLKPKLDGRLKLTLDDFDPCEITEAQYWASVRRCRRCGKVETEIT